MAHSTGLMKKNFFAGMVFAGAPDSKQLAFWQIDARGTKDYLMLNNTDSHFILMLFRLSILLPETSFQYRIGTVNVLTGKTNWMKIPDDTVWRTYVPPDGMGRQ